MRGIQYHAAEAELFAGGEHDRAHQRAIAVGLAVDHQDIARLGHRHRSVNHQIVTGPNFYRERRTTQARGG